MWQNNGRAVSQIFVSRRGEGPLKLRDLLCHEGGSSSRADNLDIREEQKPQTKKRGEDLFVSRLSTHILPPNNAMERPERKK